MSTRMMKLISVNFTLRPTMQTSRRIDRRKMSPRMWASQINLLAFCSLTLLLLSQLFVCAPGRHVPSLSQHQGDYAAEDYDDDSEPEPRASASYHNQGDGSAGPAAGEASDGYGEQDNEPEAAYDETSNEREGQADLERFFDDHLGASERDGMDKENVPTNLVTRITEMPGYRPDTGGRRFDDGQLEAQQPATLRSVDMRPSGSNVVALEDADFDRVYITNATNQPFKIEALGGFDPEEAFADASRDIEDQAPPQRHPGQRQSRHQQPASDAANDPEDEDLFEDASERDEISFGPDDPEDEVKGQQQNDDSGASSDDGPARRLGGETNERSDSERNTKRDNDDDDTDESGNWLNDGVDEMEIPPQAHQDYILDMAAMQENEQPTRNPESTDRNLAPAA